MAADIDLARRFAGFDPEADISVLQACVDFAVEWYEKAGVPADTPGRMYQIWVANLAAWMYDNRGSGDGAAHIPPYIVESVHQLRPLRKAAP